MKLSECMRKMIRDYFIIFAGVMIFLTFLNSSPDFYFKISDIYKVMICALVSDLPTLIFCSSKELSEKSMRMRIIIHFSVLEVVVLVFVNVTGWITGIMGTSFLAFEIALISLLVRFINWLGDRRVTKQINERLKAMKDESGEVLEEE